MNRQRQSDLRSYAKQLVVLLGYPTPDAQTWRGIYGYADAIAQIVKHDEPAAIRALKEKV